MRKETESRERQHALVMGPSKRFFELLQTSKSAQQVEPEPHHVLHEGTPEARATYTSQDKVLATIQFHAESRKQRHDTHISTMLCAIPVPPPEHDPEGPVFYKYNPVLNSISEATKRA